MTDCPIAFVLLTHQHTPHFERLCDRLLRVPGARIFVHHDFSQSDLPRAVIERYRLSVVKPSRRTGWGKASLMYAELDALKLAYDQMPGAQWFVVLSGGCYPVHPLGDIPQRLAESGLDGYIDINRLDPASGNLHQWWQKRIFTRKIFSLPSLDRRGRFRWREVRVSRSPAAQFPAAFHFCFGSQWMMLRRSAMDYLVRQGYDRHPVMQWIEQAEQGDGVNYAPDETFIQTVLGNAQGFKFSGQIRRFIDWENSANWHPNTLESRHWDALSSSGALFARKFTPGASDALLERIDREILRVEPWPAPRRN